MHRRIKSKNRKKLKPVDPFNIRAANAVSDSGKNQPPKDDDQEIPRSFKNLFPSQEKSEDASKVKTKRKAKKNANIVEGYERKPWETDKQFLRRVGRSTHDYVQDQLVKIKYGLDGFAPSDVLDASGKRSRHRGSSESSSKEPAPKKRKKKGRTLQDADDEEKETQSVEIHATSSQKKRWKKLKRDNEAVDPLYLKEVILFGERVDAPPKLSAVPKKAKLTQSKAGAKELLLKQYMVESRATLDLRGKKRYENDGTIKCDDPVKQKVLEAERQRVIEAYRSQKRRVTAE